MFSCKCNYNDNNPICLYRCRFLLIFYNLTEQNISDKLKIYLWTFFTRLMILSQLWSNFDVLSLRALNCIGKMKIYYTDERLRAHTITYRVWMNKDEFFAMVFSFSFGSLFNNLCPATHSALLYFLCSFLPVYSFPWTNTKSSTEWFSVSIPLIFF